MMESEQGNPLVDPVAQAAHHLARRWVIKVLNAAARAEGFDSFWASDWSVDTADLIKPLADFFIAQAKHCNEQIMEVQDV